MVDKPKDNEKDREKARALLLQIQYRGNLTQTRIAKDIGYNPSYFSQVLNGKKPVPQKVINKLKTYLDKIILESKNDLKFDQELHATLNDIQADYKSEATKPEELLERIYTLINERMNQIIIEKDKLLDELKKDKELLTEDKKNLFNLLLSIQKERNKEDE